MEPRIERPIFVVGAGRSGTSLFYEMLAWHKDVAWISNYSNRYYTHFPPLAMACRLYRSGIAKSILGVRSPKPVEGYKLWDWCHPVGNSPHDPPLTEDDVNPEIRQRCYKMVVDHLRYARKKRFLNKNTRNSRRIRYLNSIFRNSKFIHIIRDSRAVIASLVTVRDKLAPWFIGEMNVFQRSDLRREKLEIAAELWMREVNAVLQDKNNIDPSQYIEIKYENFVKAPVETIRSVCEYSGLAWTREYEELLATRTIEDKNYRYKQRLTACEVHRVEELTGKLMSSLNYR